MMAVKIYFISFFPASYLRLKKETQKRRRELQVLRLKKKRKENNGTASYLRFKKRKHRRVQQKF